MNTTPQMYTKVPFAKLSKYLAHTASAEEVNYIEVTDIEAEALSGKYHDKPSPLGARLQASGKHVAFKRFSCCHSQRRYGDDLLLCFLRTSYKSARFPCIRCKYVRLLCRLHQSYRKPGSS